MGEKGRTNNPGKALHCRTVVAVLSERIGGPDRRHAGRKKVHLPQFGRSDEGTKEDC